MQRTSLLATLLLSVVSYGAEVPRKTLTVRNTTTSNLDTGGSAFTPKCDQYGNVFVRLFNNQKPFQMPIQRIGTDGKVTATFRLDTIDGVGNDAQADDFVISKDGTLTAVVATSAGQYFVRYQLDGKVASVTPFTLGREFSINRVIPLSNQKLLVSGEKITETKYEIRREPKLLIVDESGDGAKPLEGYDSPQDIRNFEMGNMVSDGTTIYSMTASNPAVITAISQLGEVTRKYLIESPDPGYAAVDVQVGGGRLAVFFLEHPKDTQHYGPKNIVRIIDADSGTPLIDYLKEGSPGCYIPPAQFVSVDGRGARFKLITLAEP